MLQGNLTADPRLRHTAGGNAVAEFRVLVNQRVKDGDEWIDGDRAHRQGLRTTRRAGGRAAAAGSRVIVIGRTETTT
jgi:hypothetical protein